MDNFSDHKLVELANKGVEEAMNNLYYRYREWVYGLSLLRKLSDYMEGFSNEERDLVLLRFYDGLQLEEIAEILKVPTGTIKSRLNRLLSRLRKNMD